MSLALGIDTGGTYTDGVLMDLETQKIIAKAKALTTREDLSVGIRECIKSLSHSQMEAVQLVSLSTTLATNAIVEGRGCEVGMLLIGHDPIAKLPVKHCAVLSGGHDIKGRPLAELELDEVRKAISDFKGKVEAVAISGYLSIRNPEHELKVKEMVEEILQVPVICAHQLTTTLGFHERTVTAALNARLIPIIAELIESVKQVLNEMQIAAPLMIVKGDGSLMSESLTRERPIETILSGPAASIVGATSITEVKEALVLDMGGTTTDIAILQEGIPRLNKEGAKVGGWLTRVEAAEIYTYGLGGDSYVQITKERKVVVGPQRVWPLAVVAHKYSYLIEELQEAYEYTQDLIHNQVTDCFMLLKTPNIRKLSEVEDKVVKLLEKGPHSLLYLADRLEMDPNLINLQSLVSAGFLAKVSVTPTDILHAKGCYLQWNQEASIIGAKILAHKLGKTLVDFLELAMEAIVETASLALLKSINNFEGAAWPEENVTESYFLNKILGPKEKDILDCSVRIKIPIIAIGAPVKSYLPEVAQRLNTELIIPEDAEVANAVGAAMGRIMESVRVLIKPGIESGFIVHAPWERKAFIHLDEATEWALAEAKSYAQVAAKKAGAANYQLVVNHEEVYSGMNLGWDDKIYVETKIEVTAVGRPQWEDNATTI